MDDLPGKLDNVGWQGILEAAIIAGKEKPLEREDEKKQTKRTYQFFSETNIHVPETRNTKRNF